MLMLSVISSTAIKLIPLGWSIATVTVGLIASLWVSGKVAETRISALKEDIDELKQANQELQHRLLENEREIAKTLKAIEVKIGELATTVALIVDMTRGNK